MKILAIMGSPRKGDSFEVVRLIEEKMKALGGVEFEYLFLKDAYLEMCSGCNACFAKGEEFCPLKDDRAAIEKKMLEADGVIFSSPAYVVNVTALVKNFIDRFAYCCHRPRFFDQYALLVSNAAGFGLSQTLQALDWAARTWGFNIAGKIGVVSFRFAAEAFNKKTRFRLEREAEKFYRAIEHGDLVVPNIISLIGFKIQRMLFAQADQENADYRYWKRMRWLEPGAVYYCPAKINIFKRTLASLLFGFLKTRKTF